jgi:AraC-like DNA-binding protein
MAVKPKQHDWEQPWCVPLPDRLGAATLALVDLGLTSEEPVRGSVTRLRRDGRTYGHIHLPLQVSVVLEGRMECNLGRGWCGVGVGQAWACGSLEAHPWRVLSRELVEFRFDFLPSLFSQVPNLKGFDPTAVFRSPSRWGAIGTTRVFRRSLAALGRQLAKKHEDPVTPGEAFVDLMRFLDLLGKEVSPSVTPEPPPWSDPADIGRIRAALELIERSQGRRVSADEAARVCHMARSTFDRIFKRMTGFSYAQFALRSRVAHAARLLKSGAPSIKTVARSLGFTDSSHFHHAFTAQYGVTPAQYRAACFGKERGV